MDDAPALASYVDTRLRYGVEQRIDAQLLNGNGTGQNISGMTNSGNYTAFTPESGDNAIDSINRAIYEVIGADYAPTAIMMNPKDWGAIERTKINDSYVFGSPGLAVGPVLWGLPVVVTNAMTEGAMDVAYQVWNRQGTIVEMSESDDTNFQKNLVTVRAESRLALAVYRPASVQYGDLTL
jgi:HK97 family phage major capsid protein